MKRKNKLKLSSLTVDKLYFTLAIFWVVVAFVVIAASKGKLFENLFWHGTTLGIYPDLFESVIHARTRDPYSLDAIYPAFAYCLIYFFNFFIPGTYTDNFDDLAAICDNPETLVIAHLFYTVITLSIAYFIIKTFGDEKYKGKYLLVLIFVTSSPFIFLIERGNTVIITIVFLFIYFLFYNSENKWLRELALICLACAAAMKLYPAVFGLLLIADKKWKEAFRAIIYGIVVFVVPFFFMGGISQIPQMLSNSLTLNSNTLSGSTGFGYGFKVSATSSIGCILDWLFGKSYVIYVKMVVYFFVGLLLFSSLFIKNNWKRIAALSLVVILMPDFSFIYNVIYLLVPLAFFIKEKKGQKLSVMNIIYTFCFVGAFAPMPFGDIFRSIGGYNNMNWGTLVSSISLIGLAILISAEGLYTCIKNNKKIITVGVLVCSLILGVVPYVLSNQDQPNVQNIESIWQLTEQEKADVDSLYDFVMSDIEDDNSVLCFPKVSSLEQFDEYKNNIWYTSIEATDSVTSSRLFTNLDPQFVVMDLTNYSNYKYLIKNEECTEDEYQNIIDMQEEILSFVNKKDYDVVKYVATENDRYIAVWEKSDYAENVNFWNDAGNGEQTNPYIISTAEQLKLFSDVSNCGRTFKKEYILLNSDIDASTIGRFTPIAKYAATSIFQGVFDGGGHTISNLNLKYEYEPENTEPSIVAFVNNLNGTIANLCIEDSTIVGTTCAVFARYSNSENALIVNCISRNNTVKASKRAGAIADKYGASIVNCISINNTVEGAKYQGFVSEKNANPTIRNCYTTSVNDDVSYASIVTTEAINSENFAELLNDAIDNYEAQQIAKNDKQKKASKKVIIPDYKHWEINNGKLSFAK